MLLHTTRIRRSSTEPSASGIREKQRTLMSAAEIVKLFQKWMNLRGPLLGGISYRTEPLQGYSPSIEYHNEALSKTLDKFNF